MIALKKILVATDFSEPSEAALAYGLELARQFGSTVVVAHVVENALTGAVGADGFVFSDPGLQQHLEASARRRLDTLLSDEDRAVLGAETIVIASNTPAYAIVDYARTADDRSQLHACTVLETSDEPADAITRYARCANIDLIVMGTHGRSGLSHLLVGSVAERVVRTAPCPVLTVRHPEHEFVVPDATPHEAALASRAD